MMKAQWGTARWSCAAASLLAWLVFVLTGPATLLRAEGETPPPEFGRSGATSDHSTDATTPDAAPTPAPQPSEKRESTDHWLSKLARSMRGAEPDSHARSSAAVLNAFRGVVVRPAKSTVRIFSSERQVALGVIIDPDGFIATKASELSGEVVCQLCDGTRHKVELAGIDRGSDLALLRITAQNLPAVRWSQHDPPAVGGWVVSAGPGDLPQAIGVVSVAPHSVRGGVLGIQMTEDQLGPRITFVVPESGAAVAGLARGDVITHVNGQRIEGSNAVVAATSQALPDDKIELTVLRGREEMRISATLGSVATTLSSQRARFQDQLGGPLSQRRVLFPSALEHDSVLAPNQCGGPLLDLDGNVIGINIARASRIASYAIPASVARPILEQLKLQAVTVPVATSSDTSPLSSVPAKQ